MMKIVPQLITFAVLVVLGAVAYYYYNPFRELVDDVSEYSSVIAVKPTEPTSSGQVPDQNPDQSRQVISGVTGQSEPVTYAAVDDPVTGNAQQKADTAIKPPVQAVPPVLAPTVMPEKTPEVAVAKTVSPPAAEPAIKQTQGSAEPSNAATEMAKGQPGEDKPAQRKADEKSETAEQQALRGLAEARSAWQQGDFETAVNRYSELMLKFPNHPDFAGELGNIYYHRGQSDLAVDAYSEAFGRLIRRGDYKHAWNILSYIRRMDYRRAQQLEQSFVR